MSSLPLPPDELIERVVSGFANEHAEEHRAAFLRTGRRSLEDLERALAAVGDSLSAHERILEFGCGCGRIMRWMESLAAGRALVGTDIDSRAIEWASANLPFAGFDVNDGLPPTRYRDGEFDLILNHSVFTHLDEQYQDQWLAELQRITCAEGLLVLNVHGEHAFAVTEQRLEAGSRQRSEWRAVLEREGILFIADDAFVGSAFPDFYHSAFHAPWYVFEHWSRWFDVLAYLPQSSLGFQDQVVLRRRRESAAGSVPIRARPTGRGNVASAPPPSPVISDVERSLEMPTAASRFGSLGLLARRGVFRAARPVLNAQQQVNRSLAEAIFSLEARLDDRMPPLVQIVLRQQAERIERLEGELRAVRGDSDAC